MTVEMILYNKSKIVTSNVLRLGGDLLSDHLLFHVLNFHFIHQLDNYIIQKVYRTHYSNFL